MTSPARNNINRADETAEVIRQIEMRRKIEDRLSSARRRLDAAEAQRRGAMRDIGSLLRAAKVLDEDRQKLSDPRSGSRVEMTHAEYLTGFSRPTLYKLRDEIPERTGDPRTWSNEDLAEFYLGYGGWEDDRHRDELDGRYPTLSGWRFAEEYLGRVRFAKDVKEHGFDPWDSTRRPQWSEEEKALYSFIVAATKAIAAGPLADIEDPNFPRGGDDGDTEVNR